MIIADAVSAAVAGERLGGSDGGEENESCEAGGNGGGGHHGGDGDGACGGDCGEGELLAKMARTAGRVVAGDKVAVDGVDGVDGLR